MNKKKPITILVGLTIALACFFVLKTGVETVWTMCMDFTNPGYYESLEKKWENKSTNFLIGKLGHPSMYDSIASSVLARRKDLSRKQEIIKIAETDPNIRRRESALSILFSWDAQKATDISIEILKSGGQHPLYKVAILHLAHKHHKAVFPYLIALAESPERYNNGSVGYLEDYGQVEALPILEAMLKDSKISKSDEHMVQNAIQSIKEKNNIPT